MICAVNGVAAGASANIPLACDLVLAARSASFIRASARSAWYPIPAAPGCCRASAYGTGQALAMLGERLAPNRPSNGG